MAHLGPSLILEWLGEKLYVSWTMSAGQKWSSTEGLETSCYSTLRSLFIITQKKTQNLNWDLPYFGKKKNIEYFAGLERADLWRQRFFCYTMVKVSKPWDKRLPMTSINLGAWGYVNIQKSKIIEADHPGFWLESTFKIYTSAPMEWLQGRPKCFPSLHRNRPPWNWTGREGREGEPSLSMQSCKGKSPHL